MSLETRLYIRPQRGASLTLGQNLRKKEKSSWQKGYDKEPMVGNSQCEQDEGRENKNSLLACKILDFPLIAMGQHCRI